MSIFAELIIIVLVPVQLLPLASQMNKIQQNPEGQSRVEGASTERASITFQSLRGSISQAVDTKEKLSASGYVPERKQDYVGTKIFSTASVVLDVDSGTILHYENGKERFPIASLTKIMTAVVVVEEIDDLDEPVSIDADAVRADGTKVGCPSSVFCPTERLHLGETVRARDLLAAMLLDSANDAAIALSTHVAGSQKEFAILMNEKAEELKMSDSNFCNPTGLDEEGCYSSAYDLAKIAAYSMRYEIIWDLMKRQEMQISSCDGKYLHQLKNTDLLLGEIPNCLGGKTGFTYSAGKSLMMAAVDPIKHKHRIIAVILNDNNRWEDMKSLINWSYENYEWR